MTFADRISRCCSQTASMLLSFAKVALQSRRPIRKGSETGELVVLGNGPGLKHTLAANRRWLEGKTLMAVNFAANTPVWRELKPKYYILADPHFFTSGSDKNVDLLQHNLQSADWEMTLLVPALIRKKARKRITNRNIHVGGFNMVGIEGFSPFCHAAFSAGLGMPRPRNVLIPALMTGLRLGFKTIYVAGADHSWTRTLSVDENNRVVSIQPHFYEEDKAEKERVASVYEGVRLHEVLGSMVIAFESYFRIEAYARKIHARILNVTPGSFIDAFERFSPTQDADSQEPKKLKI